MTLANNLTGAFIHGTNQRTLAAWQMMQPCTQFLELAKTNSRANRHKQIIHMQGCECTYNI
uniref:Uncharacterized protein n=1 Tax=Tolypothrix bouteillei VB521301 TaxID=1479485 RepID=A0A0C1N7P2_9CYAN